MYTEYPWNDTQNENGNSDDLWEKTRIGVGDFSLYTILCVIFCLNCKYVMPIQKAETL